jgi:cytochrome c oxidase subunit IV
LVNEPVRVLTVMMGVRTSGDNNLSGATVIVIFQVLFGLGILVTVVLLHMVWEDLGSLSRVALLIGEMRRRLRR